MKIAMYDLEGHLLKVHIVKTIVELEKQLNIPQGSLNNTNKIMKKEKFLGKTISKKDADKDSFEDVTNYITEKMYSEEEPYTNVQQKSLELNKQFVNSMDSESLDNIMSEFDEPKQQTAIEWLEDCLTEQHPNESFVWNTRADLEALFKQAKEMEKQQMIDAFNVGFKDTGLSFLQGEQYYNETFNK